MRAGSFLNQNLGYLCGYEGVTKTTDGGVTFTEVGAGNFPFTELRDIHFLMKIPDTFLAATQMHLQKQLMEVILG